MIMETLHAAMLSTAITCPEREGRPVAVWSDGLFHLGLGFSELRENTRRAA